MGYLNATENADCKIQRVLQPIVAEWKAARIADNLFTGGNDPEEALNNFNMILALCENSGITLKAKKQWYVDYVMNLASFWGWFALIDLIGLRVKQKVFC